MLFVTNNDYIEIIYIKQRHGRIQCTIKRPLSKVLIKLSNFIYGVMFSGFFILRFH